jgi:RNA recognition motif-containing protein
MAAETARGARRVQKNRFAVRVVNMLECPRFTNTQQKLRAYQGEYINMGKELYVGSLSYETTEYDLEKLFSVSGKVTSVHLIVDLKTGEFKGCGYIRMSTEAEAKDAVDSLDGAILIDRKITVSIARPQKLNSHLGNKGGYKGKAPREAGSVKGPAATRDGFSKPGFAKPDAAKPGTSKKTADYKAGAAKAAAARPATSKPGASRTGGAAKPAGTQTRTPRTGKR